ncbi:2-succinyl-5-enolpyruvyl-6-hydroxy-3-cyclohexene-1-carboxylic-acid synthase [Chondromyces apiculatus]|uniref:2-succinyl-5-enolpyruvyl-6-hydroxy-3-cyclohexene-1-carboxylate synthase n=1 Tax=Chondromyces apiculatus DSM 436 TaxID=1192034 RepID=A0A017TED0_9BACT|nr:2-succinyl-5-enolpyruvyl-6-hydroxy-3-cyclohexene-1-carboxylic-acid synthase [Chondromyces apiculatus]EYF07574.1 2-succinyl-5-enolpyruvyl-6-hydroxy-3-cyclohexene-1-carboxylic-acid synthase [Chondromyces apiculatus DSM 436]
MSGSNLHMAWAELFVRAAVHAGVREAVICPGSRSSPLALAAAGERELRCHGVIDERAAAFFALGQARVTGKPTLFLCTSGTAGAHAFPALIEASQSFVPLLVVTADRPWELADVAAPQTIDQLKLFGDHVRHFAELGLPDPSALALRAVARVAAQAVAATLGPTPGPVHVNARFRKPLEPVRVDGPEPWQAEWEALMRRGGPRVIAPKAGIDAAALEALCERVSRAERGILVCGPAPMGSAPGRLRAAVTALAQATGFPVLAEATSQVRFGGLRAGVVAPGAFDLFLKTREFRAAHAPDLILELGAPPTSAGYAAYLAEHPTAARYVIAPHGFNDPTSAATALFLVEPAEACEAITARLGKGTGGPRAWGEAFAQAGAVVDTLAARAVEVPAGEGLCEGAVVRAAVQACPAGSLLMIGNSRPVRDLDTYCATTETPIEVLHQRGASGIDGLVAGAVGAAVAARGAGDAGDAGDADDAGDAGDARGAGDAGRRPVTLVLGDLSLLHDLTSLGLAARAGAAGATLVVVVVQNDGGRIFEHLPIASSAPAEMLEQCFTMPQHVAFGEAAAMFGVAYARVEEAGALDAALAEAHRRRGATLIEAVVPPADGSARAAKLQEAVRGRLGALLRERGVQGS